MKKNVGVLCAAASITRPSTRGMTTAAANSAASPRSSVPVGPWPAPSGSPAGDIPREVYRTTTTRRRRAASTTRLQLPAGEKDEDHPAEGHRDRAAGDPQPLAQDRRQDEDMTH